MLKLYREKYFSGIQNAGSGVSSARKVIRLRVELVTLPASNTVVTCKLSESARFGLALHTSAAGFLLPG
jgi:hypothetical protein